MRMGDHLGNQKQIREAMVVRPGQSGQYYGAVVAGLFQKIFIVKTLYISVFQTSSYTLNNTCSVQINHK